MSTAPPPARQIRAVFDAQTITVYQAFSPSVADPAVEAQRFVPPFSLSRMTWIKPSFLWMMYRSGWATKPGQERVLAVAVTRSGFECALAQACLSHFDPRVYVDEDEWQERKSTTSVRVQWDPERNVHGSALPWRSLQVGLAGGAAAAYAHDWIVHIEDVTSVAEELRSSSTSPDHVLPHERPYPLSSALASAIGATPSGTANL